MNSFQINSSFSSDRFLYSLEVNLGSLEIVSMVGMLKEDDLKAYLELFKNNPLTDTQTEFLLKAKRGEFLLNIDNKNRIGIKIEATATERKMMGEEE